MERLERVDEQQARAILRWRLDPENRFYTTLCQGPDDGPQRDWRALQEALNGSAGQRFGIFDEEGFVGEVSFAFDHSALLRSEPRTAWVGIGIGEARARGRGIGTRAMGFVEETVRDLGGRRIELGVFEYNEPALRFYRKLGYRHFETLPRMTWWEGRWWADLRHEKSL